MRLRNIIGLFFALVLAVPAFAAPPQPNFLFTTSTLDKLEPQEVKLLPIGTTGFNLPVVPGFDLREQPSAHGTYFL